MENEINTIPQTAAYSEPVKIIQDRTGIDILTGLPLKKISSDLLSDFEPLPILNQI
ncbi:hypothetical protein FACS1894110_17160 [Spirochaetia bacterium]|nr:hypothetical protein FACS1894110_17160 [Spirochaetia bacterium]